MKMAKKSQAAPKFVDHIALMVSNVRRAKTFLGLPYHELPDNAFNKDRIGLNHIALGVRSLSELRRYEAVLTTAKIKHSGIQTDNYGGKEFIWFDDPDGIRLEFYLRPQQGARRSR